MVTSTVRDRRYQRVLAATDREATRDYSLHTTGCAFDIARLYRSRAQALAFQFVLDRLTARGPDRVGARAGRDPRDRRVGAERLTQAHAARDVVRCPRRSTAPTRSVATTLRCRRSAARMRSVSRSPGATLTLRALVPSSGLVCERTRSARLRPAT